MHVCVCMCVHMHVSMCGWVHTCMYARCEKTKDIFSSWESDPGISSLLGSTGCTCNQQN